MRLHQPNVCIRCHDGAVSYRSVTAEGLVITRYKNFVTMPGRMQFELVHVELLAEDRRWQ
jgi:hypothetical protein